MNFIDSGVTFRDILNAGLVTGGLKLARGKYTKDTSGNIIKGQPIINAIDIDWNSAEIPGIDDPITSTGQLLAIIGNVKAALGNITPSGSGSGSTDNKSIIERLTEIETAVQALQQNPGGSVPENLQEDIDNIKRVINNIPSNLNQTLSTLSNNINTTQSAQQQIGTRLVAAEASVTSLSSRVDTVETNVNKFKHVIIEKEDYDNLSSYEPNTLYFIIGEPDFGGGGGNTDGRIELDSISTSLTINSDLYKNSDIVLEPGKTYNISGTLRGHIIVDASTKTAAEMKELPNTTIVLSNVIINSDANYAIYYKTPEENTGYKDLVVKYLRIQHQ